MLLRLDHSKSILSQTAHHLHLQHFVSSCPPGSGFSDPDNLWSVTHFNSTEEVPGVLPFC